MFYLRLHFSLGSAEWRKPLKSAPGPLAAQLRVRLVGRVSRVSVDSSLQVLFFIRNCSVLGAPHSVGRRSLHPPTLRFPLPEMVLFAFRNAILIQSLSKTALEPILKRFWFQKLSKNRSKIDPKSMSVFDFVF